MFLTLTPARLLTTEGKGSC